MNECVEMNNDEAGRLLSNPLPGDEVIISDYLLQRDTYQYNGISKEIGGANILIALSSFLSYAYFPYKSTIHCILNWFQNIIPFRMAGVFPNARNIYELRENLFNKVDMVLPKTRWAHTHPDIPPRLGTLQEINKYDAGFFGVHERQSHSLDAMARILQEKTVEAIFDAGIHPSELGGTKTGVFIGVYYSENDMAWYYDNLEPQTFAITGSEKSLIAHRLSYFLKLKGPSCIVDTACSSSLYGLEMAYKAIRQGDIDSAIVGAANLCLHPGTTIQYSRLGALSKEGVSKPFDAQRNGFVRSEGVAVVILQKGKDSKRAYAQVVHAKLNSDGYKEQGLTAPCRDGQESLLKEFYDECGVDRHSLSFVEAHSTGTRVGDPEECAAIDNVLATGRKTPLLIGSIKSNIGHTEAASGLCSIIKCIIAMETGFIPPNIHYHSSKGDIIGLIEGRLRVPVDKVALENEDSLIGINNVGLGGTNAHVLLRQNSKRKIILEDNLSRLVVVSGRTVEAITVLFDQITITKSNPEYIALLHEVFKKNIQNHLYRGYIIVSKFEEVSKSVQLYSVADKELYFTFGEFHNWYEVAGQLMALPAFNNCFLGIKKILTSNGINILDVLMNNTCYNTSYFPVLGAVVTQVAITQVLNILEVKPYSKFASSVGGLVLAYFDGILNLEETINCALALEKILSKIDEENKKARKGNWKAQLKINKVEEMKKYLLKSLSNSLLGNDVINKTKTVNYFIDILTRKHHDISLKPDTIILKIGQCTLDQTDDKSVISLYGIDGKNHLSKFLSGIGSLYLQGFNPQISKLYPKIDFPVSRGTPMISPYIRWNHDREKFVPNYSIEHTDMINQGIRQYRIDINDNQWTFLSGHVIDNDRNLFPATAYIYMVWDTFAVMHGVSLKDSRVLLENCRFLRATGLSKNGVIVFGVAIQNGTGNFEIVEDDSVIVTGMIRFLTESEIDLDQSDVQHMNTDEKISCTEMNKKDVYQELRLRGYNYSGEFKGIEKYNYSASRGYVKWNENWITFIDNMLQMKLLQLDSRLLFVPKFISKLKIVADAHCKLVDEAVGDMETLPNLPVYSDSGTGDIKCGGITISGLTTSSIERKINPNLPVLESYKFVPNFTEMDLLTSARVNVQLIIENALPYEIKAVELIDEFTDENVEPLTPAIKLALDDETLIRPSLKILTARPMDVDVEIENKELDTETNCMLVIASKLLSRPRTLKKAFAAVNNNGFIITREDFGYNVESKMRIPDIAVITAHKTSSETLLLLQKPTPPMASCYINILPSESFSWISKVQNRLNWNPRDDIILYSQRDPRSGILGMVKCLRREPIGRNIRCVFIVDEDVSFNPNLPVYFNHLKKNIAINVYENGTWGTYRHLLLDNSKIKECKHCFLDVGDRGGFSNLKWTEGHLSLNSALELNPELVNVHYATINFRDIMAVTRKIDVGSLAVNRLHNFLPGCEFSGKDDRGNRVMGSVMSGGLANLVLADPLLTYKVPGAWTLEEAATVPLVYTTVLYALVMRGHMKRGDNILIHSGTGGIGQAAIQIASHYGCNVFTTVGTPEKREFLKKVYPQIKDKNIGNSHDTSFEQMVFKETNGKGVDIALNSLAEEKLVATIRCLAKGGRFLEIGKFDLLNNNSLSLLLFQKQASFHGVMLDKIFYQSPDIKLEIRKLFKEMMRRGAIRPLNRNVFNSDQVEQAFRYMANDKRIGKVMIKIRETEDQPVTMPRVHKLEGELRYHCDPEKVYLIIGGLGGFGLELTDWLVLRGAKKLVLTSRKGMCTGYQNYRIRLWESYGVFVKLLQTPSLATKQKCKQVIEECLKLGRIAAIFNLAVVLDDAIFENQTPESYTNSFGPKAFATKHLDELTRQMCPDLGEFVVFSSYACGRGHGGQTNYGMTNSVMENICQKRKRDGYPALAVQWGAVGEVGAVVRMEEEHKSLDVAGTLKQPISSCLQTLDFLLRRKDVTIVSSTVVGEKPKSVDNVVDAVINIMFNEGQNNAKCISHHSTLAELGMDSMTAVEIKLVLEREFGIFLSTKDMRSMTLARLKEIQKNKCYSVEASEGETDMHIETGMLFKLPEDESDCRIPYIILSQPVGDKCPKVVLFPGMEGCAKVFKTLAKHINNVVALQYTLDGQTTSLNRVVENLLPTVENLISPDQPFFLVAYSYGMEVALEMVNIFESRGHTGTLISIDGAPLLIQRMLKGVESENFFQTSLICQILSSYLPNDEFSKSKINISHCQTWEEKLDLGEELMKNYAAHKTDYLRLVASAVYKRISEIKNYNPSYRNLKSNIKLFKPSYSLTQNIPEDYGLSQYFDKPVEVQCFEGDHLTVLENEQLAEAINLALQKVNLV